MGGFGIPLRDFIGTFQLGLEGDSFLIPVIDSSVDGVHGHDAAHEGGRDASREIYNKDILVGDVYKG